ncbi:MAG TPA: hypothetical protein VFM14_18075 [Gemmatimonadales bacterium]|nr:hypothetical protein [Gemmatimonadales bacterium]
MALLLAGLPVEIPGQTVNRLCGSGLQAVIAAAHATRAGEGEMFIAGAGRAAADGCHRREPGPAQAGVRARWQ